MQGLRIGTLCESSAVCLLARLASPYIPKPSVLQTSIPGHMPGARCGGGRSWKVIAEILTLRCRGKEGPPTCNPACTLAFVSLPSPQALTALNLRFLSDLSLPPRAAQARWQKGKLELAQPSRSLGGHGGRHEGRCLGSRGPS